MAEELNVSVFDEIRAAIRTECDEKGFAWPPESSEAVGAANLVLRLAACLLERKRASRQAWAEEAMRMDALVREALELLNDVIGYVPEFFQEKWDYPAQIASIAARRPQCAVRPDGSGVDLAVEGGGPTP